MPINLEIPQPKTCPKCGTWLEWKEGQFSRYCPECKIWWRAAGVRQEIAEKFPEAPHVPQHDGDLSSPEQNDPCGAKPEMWTMKDATELLPYLGEEKIVEYMAAQIHRCFEYDLICEMIAGTIFEGGET